MLGAWFIPDHCNLEFNKSEAPSTPVNAGLNMFKLAFEKIILDCWDCNRTVLNKRNTARELRWIILNRFTL